MNIIGKGGYGTIYTTENPRLVQKYHLREDGSCDSLYKEFAMQRIAYEATKNNPIYAVPKPRKWVLGKDGCSFIMDRIYSPDGGNLSWHLYLSEEPNFDNIISENGGFIRGRYLGIQSLLNNIPDINVSNIVYYAGLLMGDVQYGSMQTAVDTELIIGSYYDPKIVGYAQDQNLFLIDYDQSNPWHIDDPPYENLVWALEAEPYWPYPGSPFYAYFEKGYLESATKHGLAHVAEKVLDERG